MALPADTKPRRPDRGWERGANLRQSLTLESGGRAWMCNGGDTD